GRSNVYFTLGRICGRKGLRADATRNFLEYATRMQQEGRVEEGMRALAEVVDLMPELAEVRRLVEEYAERAGISLSARKRNTPLHNPAQGAPEPSKLFGMSRDLVFLDIDYDAAKVARGKTPPPLRSVAGDAPGVRRPSGENAVLKTSAGTPAPAAPSQPPSARLEDLMIFDPRSELNVADEADLDKTVVDGASIVKPYAELTAPVDALPDFEPTDAGTGSYDAVSSVAAESMMLDNVELEDPALVAPGFTTPDFLSTEIVHEPADVATDVAADANEPADEPAAESVEHGAVPNDLNSNELEFIAALDSGPIEPVAPGAVAEESITELAAVDDVVMDDTRRELPDADFEQAGAPGVSAPTIDVAEIPVAALDVIELESAAPVAAQSFAPATEATPREVIAVESAMIEAANIEDADSEVAHSEVAHSDDAGVEDAQASEPLLTIEQDFEQSPPTAPLDGFTADDEPPVAADVCIEPLAILAEEAPEVDANVEAEAELMPAIDFDAMLDMTQPRLRAIDAEVPDGASHDRSDVDIGAPEPELQDDASDVSEPVERVAEEPIDFELLPATEFEVVDDHAIAPSSAALDDVFDSVDELPPLIFPLPEDGVDGTHADVPELELVEPDEMRASIPDLEIIDATASNTSGLDFIELDETFDDKIEATIDAANELDAVAPDAFASATFEPQAFEADTPPHVDAELPAPRSATADASAADAAASEDQSSIVFLDVTDDDLGDLFGDADIPTAIVAAEATLVASSRCSELRSASDADPGNFSLRRRLAEALFEAGNREEALGELSGALAGAELAGSVSEAADMADELVRVAGDDIAHHQKRLELSIRLGEQSRLRDAYLDLADLLVRRGEDLRAKAVYARVLEIDPWDDRARTALGDAAPPPPSRPAEPTPDDEHVNLSDWLRDDDEPASTRLRMREPDISGDEQDDFNTLLKHFKEGVARSLGEDDYESHYDLGVAYKEMGLLEDAIGEFQMALRSRNNRLAAYEALGQCFIEQGSHKVAVTVLSRALHEPGVRDEQRIGVLYLLGISCEVLQRFDESRGYFQRVYATDIHFRDVAQRLADLERTVR
ncbi:MAG: tetratricopeptide repeat protein, partial [Gemmatimonas sp.]